MDDMLKDPRFAHVAKDPRFRRIPKSERKVKIDKRFQSMFSDKKFSIKYTIDKRGRPVSQSSTENLKKYYELSSESEDEDEDEDLPKKNEPSHSKTKEKKKKLRKQKDQKEKEEVEGSEEESFSSNGDLLRIKPATRSTLELDKNEDSENDTSDDALDSEVGIEDMKENENQLYIRRKNETNEIENGVKKKLRDLTVDYARGEGILMTDSSSDEESSEYDDEENEVEHNWGELDKEAETTDEITHRLAACNMDWDRIRAVDLMVLFNSFLPSGGLIHSVTIYPSDFGLERMKEEEVKGPIELVEAKSNEVHSDAEDDENEEGSNYHMEKLRQYQLNRLKYYYAVIDCDSSETANKIYTECDGIEYESTATKLDLRFIPDDMTFEHEPKEVCDKVPELSKYQPRQFTTTALQQVKVELTWDETNPERQEITEKLNSGKIDEVNENDIQAYLASGTSDDDSDDDKIKNPEIQSDSDLEDNKNPIEKYKSLLKSIEEQEEAKKKEKVELEFTWGLGMKEKTEKLVKEKLMKDKNLTPFEQFLEKRKAKKKAKKDEKKKLREKGENGPTDSESEDSIPSDIDMNDPYFAEEMKNIKSKNKKQPKSQKEDDLKSDDEEENRKRAELELLLMDKADEENKKHFNMKKIEEMESASKSKKKRLNKKKDAKKQENEDDFEVDVKDPRFASLFSSHHFNIDPADPHYRKTKGTEALISEKLKRRANEEVKIDAPEKQSKRDKNVSAEIAALVKSVKRNTKNISKPVK
ncbi:ESF1 homolog [Cephus cinctus]|uniref:ESF1 homolog n=1 Tax=Cephus cinctus TaxID=211228 RepID=A0AAJ7FE62_CEPCN|nr:ESF1 homolog [Cephus cinctus]